MNTKINFDEILTDACYEISDGIIDLSKLEHLNILRKILRKHDLDNKLIDDVLSDIKRKKNSI